MTSDHFFDLKIWKNNSRDVKDASKKDILISKVPWMNFGQTIVNCSGKEIVEKHPNKVWLHYTYVFAEPWSKVSLLKGQKKTQSNVSLAMPVSYPSGCHIKPKKVDLLKMLPEKCRSFWEHPSTWWEFFWQRIWLTPDLVIENMLNVFYRLFPLRINYAKIIECIP